MKHFSISYPFYGLIWIEHTRTHTYTDTALEIVVCQQTSAFPCLPFDCVWHREYVRAILYDTLQFWMRLITSVQLQTMESSFYLIVEAKFNVIQPCSIGLRVKSPWSSYPHQYNMILWHNMKWKILTGHNVVISSNLNCRPLFGSPLNSCVQPFVVKNGESCDLFCHLVIDLCYDSLKIILCRGFPEIIWNNGCVCQLPCCDYNLPNSRIGNFQH